MVVAVADGRERASGRCSGVAEQRGEARARVEAREAEPVDRAAALDERRRLQVADQRVVLDPRHQRLSISRPSGGQRLLHRAVERRLVLLRGRLVERASRSGQRMSASASVAASTTST